MVLRYDDAVFVFDGCLFLLPSMFPLYFIIMIRLTPSAWNVALCGNAAGDDV